MRSSTAWRYGCMHADDPRERLRRYLEQRRDLGESELMLDSMDVGEVLRLIGAGHAPGSASRSTATAPGLADATPAPGPSAASQDAAPPVPAGGDGDWRAALRATGASPEAAPPSVPRRAFPAPPLGEVDAPAGDAPRGLVANTGALAHVPADIAALPDLAAIAAAARACRRCPLYATAQNA